MSSIVIKNVAFSKCHNLMNEQRVQDRATGVFFWLGSTLDPLWRGTCFITVKKQMETAMNVLVINPDRSARTYNRIFLVQRLLITCHLFNVIENKWMYIHFTCQKNSFLRIICVLVKSNQWFRGISKINYLLTPDSFYNVTMLLEHFPY